MAYHGGYNEPNESIYNIIPAKIVRQEKPPMYRSRHPADKPPTASSFHQNSTTHPCVSNLAGDAYGKVVPDRASRSMGKAPGSNTSTPRDYMRKMEHTQTVSTLAELKLKNPEQLRPTELKPKLKGSVASSHEAPIMNLVTTKNFIVANAVQNILAAPTKISQGAKDFLMKEDYGKVPKYLAHVKEDIRAEYDYIQRLEQERADMTRSNVQPIGEEERQELITNLKIKWEQVNSGYQGSTHITKLDTVGKTRRKEGYEAELAQIEKEIEKLNRKNILVNGHC
jgi:hypothetical protein